MPIPGPLPASVLLLDDGTGTFPTDISAYLDLSAGLSLSGYGRQDEFSQAQSASLTVTLKNNDGTFTTGAHVLSPGMKIRWQEKDAVGVTHDRFTGRISSVDLGWNGAPGFKADVTVTAVDVLADLTRRPMRSMLEEEVLVDAPTAYYTLGEASGSSTVGDTSGNNSTPLKVTGTGMKVGYQVEMSAAGGVTGIQFGGGQYLRVTSRRAFLSTGSWTVSALIVVTSAPASNQAIFAATVDTDLGVSGPDYATIDVTSSGTIRAVIAGSNIGKIVDGAVNVCDGELHHIAVTLNVSTNTLSVYVDGVLDNSGVAATTPAQNLMVCWVGNGDAKLSGLVAHVSLYDGTIISSTRFADYYALGSGTLTESTDARLSRLANYAGIAPTTTGGSGQTVSIQQTSGGSVFDAMQAVATAEDGILFVDGSGNLQMQGRSYRAQKTTPDLTIGSGDPGVDTTPTLDTQQKINQVSVTRAGGAEQVVKAPELSDPNEPVYDSSLDLIVDTDDAALDAANWIVAKHTTPGVRISTLTLDLLTSPNAADFLALQIGDRISLSGLPAQMFANATDYTIEGWSETRSVNDATLTLNLLPWSLFQALVLDDATEGLLDAGVLGH